MIRVGLRFRRSDLSVLRQLRLRVQLNELDDPESLYKEAVRATEDGESLPMACQSWEEAQQVAHAFLALGTSLPEVELWRDDRAASGRLDRR